MKGARFKVYQDDAGQWRWRLQSVNGRILADSGEGYTRKWACQRAVDTVCQSIPLRYSANYIITGNTPRAGYKQLRIH